MKVFSLIFLLLCSIGFCAWYKATPRIVPGSFEERNNGIKWDDSLMKHLPLNLDTNIIVHDALGNPLRFNQYISSVFNHDAIIYQDRGVWRLQRQTEGAKDTLKQDERAVARIARWAAFQPDTIKNWQLKFDQLAHILSQADRVLVLKAKRQLILQRKGLPIKTFNIDLGKEPIGKKEFDKDGKTPEGLYDLDFKYERNDVYYKSILVSYPNESEKLHAKLNGKKPGGSILIHGTKPGKEKAKDWTAGCIAMQNDDMDTLFEYLAEGTLIEIRP